MTTRTTEEAMAVLKQYRAFLIQRGQWEAARIAKATGTVTTRDVRAAIDAAGLLDPECGDYWLGAVFNRCPLFCWTGQYVSHSDAARNIHERTIKVWKLAPGVQPPSVQPTWAAPAPVQAPAPLPPAMPTPIRWHSGGSRNMPGQLPLFRKKA